MTSGQYSFCLLLDADWLIQISEGLAVCKDGHLYKTQKGYFPTNSSLIIHIDYHLKTCNAPFQGYHRHISWGANMAKNDVCMEKQWNPMSVSGSW